MSLEVVIRSLTLSHSSPFLSFSSWSFVSSKMRSVALPAILAAALVSSASANDKPVFKVCILVSFGPLSPVSPLCKSPQTSRLLSSNSSPKVGTSGGPPRRPRRRPPLVAKPSPTLANGRSKRLPPLSLRATLVLLQRAWRLIMLSPPRSTSLSILRTSLSSFSMRSSTKRAVIAAVVTSSYSRTAFRQAGRSFPIRLHGLSCLAPILLAQAQRFVLAFCAITGPV